MITKHNTWKSWKMETLCEALLTLNTHDLIETPSGKKKPVRICQDTRFSMIKHRIKLYCGAAVLNALPNSGEGGYYFR